MISVAGRGQLAFAVDDDVVAVGAGWGVGNAAAAEVFQVCWVKRWKGVVDEKESAGIHHAGDADHSEGLLEEVVINEDIGGNDEVEFLAIGNVQRLRDRVQVVALETGGKRRANGDGAHRNVLQGCRNGQRLNGRADHVAKALPIVHGGFAPIGGNLPG